MLQHPFRVRFEYAGCEQEMGFEHYEEAKDLVRELVWGWSTRKTGRVLVVVGHDSGTGATVMRPLYTMTWDPAHRGVLPSNASDDQVSAVCVAEHEDKNLLAAAQRALSRVADGPEDVIPLHSEFRELVSPLNRGCMVF